MAEKIAIYAGEPVAAALAGYETARSARINRVCADYLLMVRSLSPELLLAEWQAVLDALNGALLEDEPSYRYLWAEVADCDGLGAKWGIDQDRLAQQLRALSTGQLAALAEISRRYWLDPSRPPTADTIAECGGTVLPDPAPGRLY